MLHSLGTLHFRDFRRIKPLLVLVFVALEGATPRRQLAELLWPEAQQPDASLRMALYQMRGLGALFQSEEPLQTTIPCDAAHLLSLRGEDTLRAYAGPFLHGVDLGGVSAEFEDWVLSKRDHLALHVQTETLRAAEGSDPANAARLAEQVYHLPGAAPATPELLARILALSLPGSALEREVGQELQEFQARAAPAEAESLRRGRMLGRHAELDSLLAWASAAGGGVATISGPGGIGKSTLGRELLRELRLLGHHVVHADAEGVKYPSDLIARLIGQTGSGRAVADTWASVAKVLGERPVILLDGVDTLDNLPEVVAEMTHALPEVRWVLTGRRSRLGLAPASKSSGMRRGFVQQDSGLEVFSIRLGGLDLPPLEAELAEVQDSAAVQLFLREAGRVRRNFRLTPATAPLLMSLTRRLQGHPLALALAASWLRVEALPELHARVLAQAATLEDAGTAQRGLALVVARSWELLNSDEQAALLRLTVFSDFDPPDAVAAGIPEREINALLEHSFLETFRPGSERLRLYPALEGIRELYAPRFPEVVQAAREAHARHYLNWFTAQSPTAPATIDDRENIRLALHSALQSGWLTPEPVYHLMSHYDGLALPASGTDTFQDLCEATEVHHAPDDVKAAAQIARMWLAQRADRLTEAQAMAERFLASPLADDPQNKMKALNTLAVILKLKGNIKFAAEITWQGLKLAEELQDSVRQAIYMINLLEYWAKLGEADKISANIDRYESVIKGIGWINMTCNLQWVKLESTKTDYGAYISECQMILIEAKKENDIQSEVCIKSFIARALLYMKKYDECINLSREILETPNYSDIKNLLLFITFTEVRALYALGKIQYARKQAYSGLSLALDLNIPSGMFDAILAVLDDLISINPEAYRFAGSISIDPRAEYRHKREAVNKTTPGEKFIIQEIKDMIYQAIEILLPHVTDKRIA